jgi:hypothetical protein
LADQDVTAIAPVEQNEFAIDRQSRPKPCAADALIQLGEQRSSFVIRPPQYL